MHKVIREHYRTWFGRYPGPWSDAEVIELSQTYGIDSPEAMSRIRAIDADEKARLDVSDKVLDKYFYCGLWCIGVVSCSGLLIALFGLVWASLIAAGIVQP